VNSPFIDRIVVKRSGEVRRAKLFYLRERVGKATRLADKKVAKKEVVADKELATASA